MTAVSPSRGWRPSPFAGPAPGGADPFARATRARRGRAEPRRRPLQADAVRRDRARAFLAAGKRARVRRGAGPTRRRRRPATGPGRGPASGGRAAPHPGVAWRSLGPHGEFRAWASEPGGSGAEIACDRNGARPRAEGTTRAGHVVAQRAPRPPASRTEKSRHGSSSIALLSSTTRVLCGPRHDVRPVGRAVRPGSSWWHISAVQPRRRRTP
jgi:hypothetical protein